jgi:hypothetical protein
VTLFGSLVGWAEVPTVLGSIHPGVNERSKVPEAVLVHDCPGLIYTDIVPTGYYYLGSTAVGTVRYLVKQRDRYYRKS